MVRVDSDGRFNLMNLLFFVRVDLYMTQKRMFACMGGLRAEGLPPVVEIPDEAFGAQRSVCAVLQVSIIRRSHVRGR